MRRPGLARSLDESDEEDADGGWERRDVELIPSRKSDQRGSAQHVAMKSLMRSSWILNCKKDRGREKWLSGKIGITCNTNKRLIYFDHCSAFESRHEQAGCSEECPLTKEINGAIMPECYIVSLCFSLLKEQHWVKEPVRRFGVITRVIAAIPKCERVAIRRS